MHEINNVNEWINLFINKIKKRADYLNGLDTSIGDGDHGDNMEKGIMELSNYLRINAISSDNNNLAPRELFYIMSVIFLSNIKGASGPLYSAAFNNISRSWTEEVSLEEFILSGINAIKKIGHCEAGDKTMLDVWIDVYEAVKSDDLTMDIIDNSVESTKEMEAKKGRASYFGDRSIGHIDPGAQSSGYFFEAMFEAGIK